MSKSKTNRMKRIFKMQSRKEEQQRAVVAAARQDVEAHRQELATIEAQIQASSTNEGQGQKLDLATVQFGRLLVESGMRASAHRRALLEASVENLNAEYSAWQAERQRANSLEKMVDRLTSEAAIEAAKEEEAQIEELSLSRRSKTVG